MSVGDRRDGVQIDADAILAGVSAIKKARGITTDAAWSAFIDARPVTGGTAGPLSTDPSMDTLLRAFLKSLIKVIG